MRTVRMCRLGIVVVTLVVVAATLLGDALHDALDPARSDVRGETGAALSGS